ncbi:MAG: DUF932 domain-containing protein [Bacteroidota bacterium]
MKTKRKHIGICLQKENYNQTEIDTLVKPLEIFKRDGKVNTFYADELISQARCSHKYGVFDFGNIVREILPKVENHINPIDFSLRIQSGVQELKLFADKFEINNSVYQKMLVLSSSSNGASPLLMNIGLFRQVCSNGLMAGVGNNDFKIITKHFNNTIELNSRLLTERMDLVEETIFKQLEFINKMENEQVSYKKCIDNLMLKPNTDERKTLFQSIKKFGVNLLSSESDKLDLTLNEFQINALNNPVGLLRNEEGFEDVIIPKINAYNCYTEVFRFAYHFINERENRRISEILLN